MSGRQGNRPDRRFAPAGSIPAEVLKTLASHLHDDGIEVREQQDGDH